MANKRLRQELIEGMEALAEIGAVDGATMRDFREDLLSPSRFRNSWSILLFGSSDKPIGISTATA